MIHLTILRDTENYLLAKNVIRWLIGLRMRIRRVTRERREWAGEKKRRRRGREREWYISFEKEFLARDAEATVSRRISGFPGIPRRCIEKRSLAIRANQWDFPRILNRYLTCSLTRYRNVSRELPLTRYRNSFQQHQFRIFYYNFLGNILKRERERIFCMQGCAAEKSFRNPLTFLDFPKIKWRINLL